MDTRRRPINAAVLEARERTSRVRAAARKGKTAQQIAQVHDYPLKLVEQILAPIADVRLSDPAALLNNRPVAAGLPPADVQVYWVGFLTASGRICGQGASFALIITLGERSQNHMNTFVEDLATPQVRNEYCESSVLGWQLYVRDQSLCKALLRWGVPSDLDGDDPTVLDDLPDEFIAPFLRGYLDGGRAATSDNGAPRSAGLALRGTEAVLTAINTMVSRGWGIKSGVVKPKPPRAELKFNRHDAQTIVTRSRAYTARRRG